MSYLDRKNEILKLLKSTGGSCNIKYLCQKLYTSRSTARRDLINLELEGIIRRHHGGITLNQKSFSENSINLRRLENQDKKNYIAKIASNFIKENMIIFLDSSSTVSHLIPYINNFKNLSIITNGINIASRLNTSEHLKCYICPGTLKPKSLSIVGEYTSNFINNFKANLSFISCQAINHYGIFEGDDKQAFCKRSMLQNSETRILLCDNTKEFSKGYFKLSDFSSIDYIVSNAKFSNELTDTITKYNSKILY